MKTIYILPSLLLYLICGGHLQAQDGTSSAAQNTITYDCQLREFTSVYPQFIKENSLVAIRYLHVNPFALSSSQTIEKVDYAYNDGMASISKFFAGTSTDADAGSSPTATGRNPTKSGTQPVDTQNNLNELRKQAVQQWKEFNNTLALAKTAIKTVSGIMRLNQVVENTMKDITITSPATFRTSVLAKIEDEQVIEAFNSSTLPATFEEAISSINDYTATLENQLINLEAINQQLLRQDASAAFTNKLKDARTIVSTLAEKYDPLGENYGKLYNNMMAIISNLDLVSRSSFTINSPEIAVANTDILILKAELKDSKGNDVLKVEPLTFRTYGGWRINTSVGVAATFGAINGSEFNLKKNPSGATDVADTGKVILEETRKNKGGAFNPVFFVHVYPTLNSFIYWRSVTIGFGPDFSDLNKSKLYIGTGIAFSRSNHNTLENVISRIGFDCGLTLGYADVLKEKYKGYADYAQFQNLDPKDFIDKALKPGFFASISINITPTKTKSN